MEHILALYHWRIIPLHITTYHEVYDTSAIFTARKNARQQDNVGSNVVFFCMLNDDNRLRP